MLRKSKFLQKELSILIIMYKANVINRGIELPRTWRGYSAQKTTGFISSRNDTIFATRNY